MNSLKTVHVLINKLTDSEKKNLLKNFLNNNDKINLKTNKLIDLLLSNNINTSNEIQLKLYGKLNPIAFYKIVNRLKQKIYEIIILDHSITSNNFSKRNIININLRKRLLQADILQLKGLRQNVLPLYNNIIGQAKKFELYEILVQALNSKQRLQSINYKLSNYNRINQEIVKADECYSSLKKSNTIFNEISNKISNSSNYIYYKDDLFNSIRSLEKLYLSTESPIIGYYYYTLNAEMFENNLQYKRAEESLQKVAHILINNESTYTHNRYGTVLLNLSNTNIFLSQFNNTIDLANSAKNYFKNLPFTLRIVDEILFYAFFYKNDFNKCITILNNNRNIIDSEMIRSKFQYFQSCLDFKLGDYKASLNNLLNYKEIEKDKEGWNINSRILLVINRIELQEYESVDLQIQSLVRFIKRLSKNKIIRQRVIIILRVLTKLIQENYDYDKVYQKRKNYLKLLESMDNECRWEIKSPELIKFDEWFMSKMKVRKIGADPLNL